MFEYCLVIFLLLVCAFLVLYVAKKEKMDKNFLKFTNLQYKFRRKNSFSRPVNTPLIPPISSYLQVELEPKNIPSFFVYKQNKLSPVRDQGSCGSCWAFTVTSVLSDRLTSFTGGDFNKNLSSQQLLQCYDFPNGCKGENPEDVFIWLSKNKFKLTLTENIPYINKNNIEIDGHCKNVHEGIMVKNDSVRSLVKYIEENNYNSEILKQNVMNMKKELIKYGPFFGTIKAYKDLFTHKGNKVYIPKNKTPIGGHAVEIVGFCDQGIDKRSGFETGYWIVKNCWGKNWPKLPLIPGYFCIQMGTNCCGIESRCVVADADVSDKIRKNKDDITIKNINEYLIKLKDGSLNKL